MNNTTTKTESSRDNMTATIIQSTEQNHQQNNCFSANGNSNLQSKTEANDSKTQIYNNCFKSQKAFDHSNKITFSILDHLEKLESAKEKNKYYCPVCGGHNLSIELETGKYQCWNGCECLEIREALSPWEDLKKQTKSYFSNYHNKNPRTKNRKPVLPVPIPEGKINLATLPEGKIETPQIINNPSIAPYLTKKFNIPANCDRQINYQYSDNQGITRYEWNDSTRPKGYNKIPLPHHYDKKGKARVGKGNHQWSAYKIDEAIAFSKGRWVLSLEGENCVEAARSLGLVAITYQGGSWKLEQIKKEIKKLQNSRANGLIIFRDNDEAGVKKAKLQAEACQKLKFPYLEIEPIDIWFDMPDKGDIVDWIENCQEKMNRENFISQLELAIHKAVARRKEQLKQIAGDDGDKDKFVNIPHWSESDIANQLTEKYRPQLAWNTDLQEWYRYSARIEGIWSKEPVEFIGKIVKDEVESIANLYAQLNGEDKRPDYTIRFINGVISLLKLDLAVRQWDNQARELLPLLNGVLDLKTRKLIPHAPGYRLTWCLPYDYNPLTCCDPIIDWLTTMCAGDRNLVQLMRCYLHGIVTGRTDWQKYLELIGPGGTGKSTFSRLAIALVGVNNTHTTTLKKLEGGRFESASIADKKLVLINDSERYAGSVSTLKALTGQDTLPYEVKYKQSTGGFTPTAMVIVAANETIQSSDYTSGLERRRVTVPMFNKIPSEKQRNLIEHRNGEILGEFTQYIPGLLNWVLEMGEVEATNIIKNYQKTVPGLAVMKAQTLVESNPIADWLDNNIIFGKDFRTNVGVAQRDKSSNSDLWYLNTDRWLYANYCEYCHNTGTNPVAVRRFGNLLSDLCKNQLGLNIQKERDRQGSYFLGLKIRDEYDEQPLLITGKITPQKSDPLSHHITHDTLPTVTDMIDIVTDNVTDESLDGDKCDGCDGYFQTQLQSLSPEKNNSDSITAINQENLPSHPSHNIPKTIDSDESQPILNPSHHPSQSVTLSVTNHHDKESKFQVGDRVKIKGTSVTGTLIKYFLAGKTWTIKTDEGFSVPYESKSEDALILIKGDTNNV